MKKHFLLPILIAVFTIAGCSTLQPKMKEVIKEDLRNDGIEISVHFKNYVDSSTIIYNLKSISDDKSMADVFRVFLQFAEKTYSSSTETNTLELQFRGKTKFKITGDYFRMLGEEYSWQNPVYTMRTFPENLMNPDGSDAYPEWTGGWLGVMGKQVEDFNDFHKKWWLDDMLEEILVDYTD